MRVNLTTGFLILIALLLFTLLLFVRHSQNELQDEIRPAMSPSTLTSGSTLIPSDVNERLFFIRKRLDVFERLSSQRTQELQQLQSLLQKLTSHAHSQPLSGNFFPLNDSLTKYQQIAKLGQASINLNEIGHHHSRTENGVQSQYLELPSISQFLDQFLFFDGSIDPVFIRDSKRNRRSDVDIVFGIPTVQRSRDSYLLSTLKNLLDNLDQEGQKRSLFVVFIAEMDLDFVKKTTAKIEERFSEQLDNGLVEIISAPAIFYETLNQKREGKDPMNDEPERVRWRTKQNLDYVYLMMYCKRRGAYYVQLEDDIVTKPEYFSKMKSFALSQSTKNPEWFVLEFCILGFIGRLMRSSDLPLIINFIIMFHKDKPVDWLLGNIAQTRFCRNDFKPRECNRRILRHMVQFRPPLFQHIGLHSSMKGKVQKLRVKGFGNLPKFTPHDNPPCEIRTSMSTYQSYSLGNAYAGESLGWLLTPKRGDQIHFDFLHQPILIQKYLFRTGNWEHPLDQLYKSTLSVLPVLRPDDNLNRTYTRNEHGYYVVDHFQLSNGTVEGSLLQFGAIHSLMIKVLDDLDNWVLFSEIYIKPKLD